MSEQKLKDPYVAARREWYERYGDAYKQAANWRRMAGIAMLTAGAAVFGVVSLAQQSSVVPYIVEIDPNGHVLNVAPSTAAQSVSSVVSRAAVARFIEDARRVTSDPFAVEADIKRVYGMAAGEVNGFLNAYYADTQPLSRGQEERVIPVVRNVIKTGGNTYRIEWDERITGTSKSSATRVERWTAVLQAEVKLPNTDRDVFNNPLGVYITQLDWYPESSAK
jgi:type IV secretion system protein VirB5